MPEPLKPIKWYKSLSAKKGRLEAGAFLVEGERAIRQVITAQPEAVLEIISIEDPPPFRRRYPTRQITESQLQAVSRTRTPQGTLAVVRAPADIYSGSLPRETGDTILLMEDIQDPGNAGTLIRTAAAFGFSGVIMTESCADPLSPKCVQSTAGTVLSVWIRRTAGYLDIAQALRGNGFTLVAADVGGGSGPSVLHGQNRLLLALGNEAAGLSPELSMAADYRLSIPVAREKAESLNVAACGAILMFLASGTE